MYADLVENNVNELAKNYGLEIVFNEKFNLGSMDYRILLHKAAQTNPDIYFIETFPPEIDILTKQLLEINPNAEITSSTSEDLLNYLSVAFKKSRNERKISLCENSFWDNGLNYSAGYDIIVT